MHCNLIVNEIYFLSVQKKKKFLIDKPHIFRAQFIYRLCKFFFIIHKIFVCMYKIVLMRKILLTYIFKFTCKSI